ncbi:MAG: WecB/TagA/CpsF family glycosyltransferase [Halocynthiibacter sp.]
MKLNHVHEAAVAVFADGMPIAVIGKLKRHHIQKSSGPDIMRSVLDRSAKNKLKHYFYGGKAGVADRLKSRLEADNPDLQVVGTYTPPFRDLTETERQAVHDDIRKSGADVVWVGISSPRQDVWMYDNCPELSQTCLGVGAAFDFLSGTVSRAPEWMQKSGLEWAYRLRQDPKRLWRRYVILAPMFLWRVAWAHLMPRRK